MFNSEGLYEGKNVVDAILALTRLHISCTQTARNDAMHIYKFAGCARLIFHQYEESDEIDLYQIEIS